LFISWEKRVIVKATLVQEKKKKKGQFPGAGEKEGSTPAKQPNMCWNGQTELPPLTQG